MRRIFDRISRFPTYIANGLIVHKALGLLKSVGIVIEPYYFYQEGAFRDVPTGDIPDFEFSEVGEEAVPAIAMFFNPPPSEEQMRRNFGPGRRCFVLKHGGEIAAYTWSDSSEIQFPPCHKLLWKHEAYLYGAATLFKYRGRKLQPFLRWKCYQALQAEGRYLLYSYSDYFNYPAIHFKEKLGGRILFTGLNLQLFRVWKRNIILKKWAEVIDLEPPAGRE